MNNQRPFGLRFDQTVALLDTVGDAQRASEKEIGTCRYVYRKRIDGVMKYAYIVSILPLTGITRFEMEGWGLVAWKYGRAETWTTT